MDGTKRRLLYAKVLFKLRVLLKSQMTCNGFRGESFLGYEGAVKTDASEYQGCAAGR